MKDGDHELLVLQRRTPQNGVGNDAVVAVALLSAVAGALAFGASILADWPVEAQGLALAAGAGGLALAVRRLSAARYPQLVAVEERKAPASQGGPLTTVRPVTRRSFLGRALLAVAGLLGVSLVVPLSSLGDPRSGVMSVTGWRSGVRLIDPDGNPLRPGDVVAPGQATVWPEGSSFSEISSVILVRLAGAGPEPPTNLDWVVEGELVAYSKICTHTGCPVGMLRADDAGLYCPCHQAQFDARRAAQPTFGPASRPLPQLPLGVDGDGYLVALGDFEQPVGPAAG